MKKRDKTSYYCYLATSSCCLISAVLEFIRTDRKHRSALYLALSALYLGLALTFQDKA